MSQSQSTDQKRKLIGTVDFTCPTTGKTLDISPVYEGEDPQGPEVLLRAERAIDMLRNPLVDRPGYVVHTAHREFRPSAGLTANNSGENGSAGCAAPAAIQDGESSCIPSRLLKEQIVRQCYSNETVLDGYHYLAAKHSVTGCGIFVVDGTLNREIYKAAIQEARDAGVKTTRLYVYGHVATYDGPGIQFTKFDELGLRDLDSRSLHGFSKADQARPTIAEQCAVTRKAMDLTVDQIRAALGKHGETVDPDRIGHYSSLEELAERVRSQKNWSAGEVFSCALDSGRFLIMKQIAPASCEMLTISQNGYHDVLTAYRFSQDELVQQLAAYAKVQPVVQEAKRQQARRGPFAGM